MKKHPDAIAWDLWELSNPDAFNPDTLGSMAPYEYLRNRLMAAFYDGMKAAREIDAKKLSEGGAGDFCETEEANARLFAAARTELPAMVRALGVAVNGLRYGHSEWVDEGWPCTQSSPCTSCEALAEMLAILEGKA